MAKLESVYKNSKTGKGAHKGEQVQQDAFDEVSLLYLGERVSVRKHVETIPKEQ
jgi:hypothetical protein